MIIKIAKFGSILDMLMSYKNTTLIKIAKICIFKI